MSPTPYSYTQRRPQLRPPSSGRSRTPAKAGVGRRIGAVVVVLVFAYFGLQGLFVGAFATDPCAEFWNQTPFGDISCQAVLNPTDADYRYFSMVLGTSLRSLVSWSSRRPASTTPPPVPGRRCTYRSSRRSCSRWCCTW